jgi:hypothetical protein
LPFGAILKEGSESEKRQKSEVPTIHVQTFVCESLTEGHATKPTNAGPRRACHQTVIELQSCVHALVLDPGMPAQPNNGQAQRKVCDAVAQLAAGTRHLAESDRRGA